MELIVSILARPEGRALHRTMQERQRANEFQSSPAPKGGRYAALELDAGAGVKFQSSPAPKGGRYPFRVNKKQYK